MDEFVIRGVSYPNTIEQDSKINRADLNTEFEQQGDKFRHWATLFELSLDEEVDLKGELGRVEAALSAQATVNMTAAGVRATEKRVKDTVTTDPEYVKSLKKYNEAKLRTGLLKQAVTAMIQRKDMLIQLGWAYRAEGHADPVIMEREKAVREIVGNKK